MNNKVYQGLIPWTKKGFDSVNLMLHELLNKPKDDWDLKVPPIAEFEIKPYEPIAQVYNFLLKRYPEDQLAQAYFLRYNNILRFLQKYQQELTKIRFMTKSNGQDLLKDEVLETLCVLSFNDVDEMGQPFFNYDEVVEYTNKLIRKKESRKRDNS